MFELIVKGKYMMIPLLLCSVFALAVIIDRARAFWANRKLDVRSLRAKVLELLQADRVRDAAVLCAHTPGPVSAVLLAGLQSYARHRELTDRAEAVRASMEKAMDDYSLHAISAVEKRLAVLSTVGNAAPLFGMAGTVTGMIKSFDVMRELGGLSGGAVAGGISEALITTAAGLLIALGAVIPYNIFTSMTRQVELQIEEASSELLDFVATRAETAR